MPGLKELSGFRANLQNIADEKNVTTQWKEQYEEYPFPENPPVPDVDIDDLLGNVELPPADSFSMPQPDLSFETLPSVATSINQDADDGDIKEDNGLGDAFDDNFEIPSISDSENIADDFEGGFNTDTGTSEEGSDEFSTGEFEAPPALDGINIDDTSEEVPLQDSAFASNEESVGDIAKEVPVRKTKSGKIDMDKWNASPDDSSIADNALDIDDDFNFANDTFSKDELPNTEISNDEFSHDKLPEEDTFAKMGEQDAKDPLADFDFSLNDDVASHGEGASTDELTSLDDDFTQKEASAFNGDDASYDFTSIGDSEPATGASSKDDFSPNPALNDDLVTNTDWLPPFDETIKDDSNEIDFSSPDALTSMEDDTSLPDGVQLSQGEEESGSTDENDAIDDFSGENFPTIQDSDGDFKLPDELNEDAFANIAGGSEEAIEPSTTFGMDESQDTDDKIDTSMEDLTNGDFANDPIESSSATKSTEADELEEPDVQDDASNGINLDEFDFDNLGKDDGGVESLGEAEGDITSSSLDEIPSLDEVESLEPELESIDDVDSIENVEPLDMDSGLDDLGEIEAVEELGDDDVEELGKDEDFDGPPKPPEMDFYTEPVDDVASPATSSFHSSQDMPDEFNSFGNIDISSPGDEAVIDEHASFDLGDNPLEESISDAIGGGFSLPDDYTQFTQEKGYSSAKKIASNEQDDISLTISEDEYQILIDRISSFPLNVRLEIEDYLAHNDDTALSKMDLVHFIVDGAKLKKVAAKLSEILDKPIQIPKGFEKRSAEEREAEKQTFKWKLRYKIIPFATIASIIVILLSCISFLTWIFVYMPIVSETIYNKGYALLNENKYSNAMSEFERAGTYKKKKRWYFKYAEALREKKQFKLAEDVYKWLLFDFNHDKKAGLEYVSMLRDELHNYERAETVLRRQVLDYHVNDETALISLGDTYLEWAREKPEKYEKARQTYSQLINMYGSKDIFLSRMMKYFIRTDKLKEVLPLKEHFVKNLKKLDLPELTELGSYLVAKRYEDDGSTPDYLNESIDDVRDILESALKRDEEYADANYNMGRFFLYNRKLDGAQYYLAKSIDKYRNTNNLSSESLMNSVNAMRLYGEILTDKKEYLQAQELYADALGKYQEYSENKLLSPNKMVGKLYQDYGDVNYFISGDLGKALRAYTQAVKQMNDSPSLRYRIAYIHYQNKDYEKAMQSLIQAHSEKQKDKNLLYGLGNTMYKRGSYDVAQGYYERLMEILEAERIRKNVLLPHAREDHKAFVEEYMRATNNLAVILNKLAMQSGSSEKNGRAMFLFGESSRAWDALTRNQQTMVPSKAVSLAYLNTRNVIKPSTSFEAEIYSDIPKTLEGEIILQNEVDK